MIFQPDLSKDFPAEIKRMITKKTSFVGGVIIEEATTEQINYLRSSQVPVNNVWKISLSEYLLQCHALEGLMGFAETFKRDDAYDDIEDGYYCSPDNDTKSTPPFGLYAFSDGDGFDEYNITFVLSAGPVMDISENHVLLGLVENRSRLYHYQRQTECRETHDLLTIVKIMAAFKEEDDEDTDYDAIAVLAQRRLEALWPKHMRDIATAFWRFLRSPLDSLPGTVLQEMLVCETPEERQARAVREAKLAALFYQNGDRTYQQLIKSRPQVR